MAFTLTMGATALPDLWRGERRSEPRNQTSTIIPLAGDAKFPGAFLVTRLNLSFLNMTCTKFASTLKSSAKVCEILTKTQLIGATTNQVKRYGYVLLRMEIELRNTLEYLSDLLLCSGRGGELWRNFNHFRNKSALVWKILKKAGVHKNPEHFPNRNPLTWMNDDTNMGNSSEKLNASMSPSLIDILEQARPKFNINNNIGTNREDKALFLVGAGLGLLSSFVVSKIFGSNSAKEIETLNQKLGKHNKILKITNERIDILAKNISKSNEVMKNILEKLIKNNENQDVHYGVLWNFDQIIALNIEIATTFRLGELTLTLLNKGILNPELIEINSLQTIVNEGLKLFPNLMFPLKIHRYTLVHVIKILRIERVGRHKYLMLIPLTTKKDYKVYKLIAHPIRLGKQSLAVPKVRDLILTNDEDKTYITTNHNNIYSITNELHILLGNEPIYRQTLQTCEWATYNEDLRNTLLLCDFEKAGKVNDTYVVETETSRLVYFSVDTKVDINCPDKHTQTHLSGLHNISLACDITTDNAHWPSKQTVTINISTNNTNKFNSAELYVAQINRSSKVHSSLRELLNQLPKPKTPYTIDFDYYELSTEQLHTYAVFSQGFLTFMVIINSILIAFLCFNWKQNTQSTERLEFKHIGDRLRKASDSLRLKKDHLQDMSMTRVRDSLKNRGSSRQGEIRLVNPTAPNNIESKSINPTYDGYVANTFVQNIPKTYPALPRYP